MTALPTGDQAIEHAVENVLVAERYFDGPSAGDTARSMACADIALAWAAHATYQGYRGRTRSPEAQSALDKWLQSEGPPAPKSPIPTERY